MKNSYKLCNFTPIRVISNNQSPHVSSSDRLASSGQASKYRAIRYKIKGKLMKTSAGHGQGGAERVIKYLFSWWVDVKKWPLGTIITSHYGSLCESKGLGALLIITTYNMYRERGGEGVGGYCRVSHSGDVHCTGTIKKLMTKLYCVKSDNHN